MRLWQRFCALNAADRRLMVESAAWLVAVRTGLMLLPFLALRRVLSSLSARVRHSPNSTHEPARVAWAVAHTARHLPFSTTCLIESLAAHAMLRRRGVNCDVRFGVRPPLGGPTLAAHAWIECDGAVLLGQVDDLSEYAALQ
jgi:hypothetical protein